MKDLDQFLLHEIALEAKHTCEIDNRLHVAVPLDLLLRVTSDFDLSHVSTELRGARFRR